MKAMLTTRSQLARLYADLGRALEAALERRAPWELVEAMVTTQRRIESGLLADATRRTMAWAHEAAIDAEAAERALADLASWTLELGASASGRR